MSPPTQLKSESEIAQVGLRLMHECHGQLYRRFEVVLVDVTLRLYTHYVLIKYQMK